MARSAVRVSESVSPSQARACLAVPHNCDCQPYSNESRSDSLSDGLHSHHQPPAGLARPASPTESDRDDSDGPPAPSRTSSQVPVSLSARECYSPDSW